MLASSASTPSADCRREERLVLSARVNEASEMRDNDAGGNDVGENDAGENSVLGDLGTFILILASYLR